MSGKPRLSKETSRLCREVVHWPSPSLDEGDGLSLAGILRTKTELARHEKELVSVIRRLSNNVDVDELLQSIRQAKQMVFRKALSQLARRRAERGRRERRLVARNLEKWMERARQTYSEIDPGRSYYGRQGDDPLTRLNQLQTALRADPLDGARAGESSEGAPVRARNVSWRSRLTKSMDALGVPSIYRRRLLEASGLSAGAPAARKK